MGRPHRDSLHSLAEPGKGFPRFWWDLPFRSPGLCLRHSLRSSCFPRTVGGSPCLAGGASTWEVLGRQGALVGSAPWNPRKHLPYFQKKTFVLLGHKLAYLTGSAQSSRTNNSEGSGLPMYFRAESRKKTADGVGAGRRQSLSLWMWVAGWAPVL